MKLTNIRKDGDILEVASLFGLRDDIAKVMTNLGLTGHIEIDATGNGVLTLKNVRRTTTCYHTYAYDNPNNTNWRVEDSGEVDKHGNPKPVAINNHWESHEPFTIKRGKYCQWADWANLDNSINAILDGKKISATFRSAYGKLRTGMEWEHINPSEYQLYI